MDLDGLLRWLTALPAIQRAQTADMLVSAATVRAVGRIRRAAIYEATRDSSYTDVAASMGVSTSAINKAVTEHRRYEERAPDATKAVR
jgi:uncharacterized protein YdbL (DUF1318 family)